MHFNSFKFLAKSWWRPAADLFSLASKSSMRATANVLTRVIECTLCGRWSSWRYSSVPCSGTQKSASSVSERRPMPVAKAYLLTYVCKHPHLSGDAHVWSHCLLSRLVCRLAQLLRRLFFQHHVPRDGVHAAVGHHAAEQEVHPVTFDALRVRVGRLRLCCTCDG